MTDHNERLKIAILLFVPIALLYQAINSIGIYSHTVRAAHRILVPDTRAICPRSYWSSETLFGFAKDEAINVQVQRLSAAVRVATESWDDNGDVDVDPLREVFEEFHQVLKAHFPKVYGESILYTVASAHLISSISHEAAQLQKPHRYNLVFTLKGTTQGSVITSISTSVTPQKEPFPKSCFDLFEHPQGVSAKLC